MKISYVLGHELPFPPTGGGGVNSLLNAVTRAMARQGHEVTTYSPTFSGAAADEVIAGVRHVRIKGAPRHPSNMQNQIRGLPYAMRVRSIIKPCDVLNCHLLSSFVFKPLRNAKVVTHTIHRQPKKVLALTALLDRIYTGSEAVSEEAGNCVPWLKTKIKTVHNCVEFEGYTERTPSKGTYFTFIYVGRFSRDKGIETLVRGFITVAKKNRAVRLIVVGPQVAEGGGEPDFFDEMGRLVATSGVAERISFLPPVYDRQKLDDLIRTADVVCLPSLGGETLNMSVLECLRLSIPTLISDLPANLPLVDNGVSGFFARAGNVEDWAKMMSRMSNLDDAKFSEMGRNAYHYGMNKFASDAIAKQYVEDFRHLLEHR